MTQQQKTAVSRFLCTVLIALMIFPLLAPMAQAATYEEPVYSNTMFTLNVGETLKLYDMRTDSRGTVDFDWFLGSNGDGILGFESDTHSYIVTVKALKPGTANVTSVMTVAVPEIEYYAYYNPITHRTETRSRVVTRHYDYNLIVTIKVQDNLAPEIVAQPQNCFAPKGGTVSATFSVRDDSSVSYQWYYADLEDTDWRISNVTDSTYTCTMTEATSGRVVCCIAQDAYGNSVTSDVAWLGMLGISSQPGNSTVALGKTAKTTVKAYGDGLKYAWYIKDPGSSKFTKSSITSNTYSVKMVKEKSGRQAYCVITDQYGNSVQTNTVTLKQEFYATITGQPANATAASGKTVTTTVKATGDGLKYQWYLKSPGGTKFYKSSVTGSAYSCKMNGENSGRQVYCVVTDKYGNSVKTKTVTLSMLAITQQPANEEADIGKTVSATVKATGDGLSYQWYLKEPGASKFSRSSVTGSTYSYKMTSAKSGRQVYCVVTDKYGNSVSSNTVTLKTPSNIRITGQPQNTVAGSGRTVSTSVTATGDGLRYQWYVKDPGGSKFSKSSATTDTYSVKMVEAKSGRQVYCVVTDRRGNSVRSNTATLTMAAPLTITAQPQETGALSDATATVTVTATGEGALTYQWYVKDPTAGSFSKSSVTGPTYTCTMTEAKSGRRIYCVITDNYGGKVTSNTVLLRVYCPDCQGSGECKICHGSGVVLIYDSKKGEFTGYTCVECGKTGICPVCDGNLYC